MTNYNILTPYYADILLVAEKSQSLVFAETASSISSDSAIVLSSAKNRKQEEGPKRTGSQWGKRGKLWNYLDR